MTAAPVEIVVPGRPESVRVLRAVATAMATRLDFGFDRVEDLSLAISEAAAFVLDDTPLTCSMLSDGDGVAVSIGGAADPGEWQGSIAQMVVESAASDVAWTGASVDFRVGR